MVIITLIGLLLLTVSHSSKAQRSDNAGWFTWYQLKYKQPLGKRLSITFDLQHRRHDLINFSSQQVLRPGLTLHMKNDLRLTAGSAIFWHNISGNEVVYRPEIRPYTFLEWRQPFGETSIVHRFRFELRYNRKTLDDMVLDGYNFNYRAGHKLGISIPIRLFGSNQWKAEIYDEVLINFGQRISVNHLDQNRIYLGLKKSLSDKTDIKMGYMYIFLPTGSPGQIETQHLLVLGISTSGKKSKSGD